MQVIMSSFGLVDTYHHIEAMVLSKTIFEGSVEFIFFCNVDDIIIVSGKWLYSTRTMLLVILKYVVDTDLKA